MRISIVLCLFMLVIACSDPGPALPEAEGIDLVGFRVADIPGSSAQRVTRTDINGNLVKEGVIQDGKRNGMWTKYHVGSNMPRVIDNYVNGRKNGVSFVYDNKGQITNIEGYLNGEFHGLNATFKHGKPLEQARYKNGKLDGMYRTFHEGRNRGKVQKEIEYKDGKQHGDYRFFNEQGEMTLEYKYNNGKKVSGGIVEPGK